MCDGHLTDRRFVKRPFLHIPKSRLLATLAAAKVPFVDDPSNHDPRFTRPRLRELMPQVAAEGLTAERLALLAERVTRAEIVLYDVLNEALMRLAPGPWPEEGPGYRRCGRVRRPCRRNPASDARPPDWVDRQRRPGGTG
jgi:tRNA(Ile)-lysidine synthase